MASEVRKLLDQIKREYQAYRSGLTGSAMGARHAFIQQKTANLANATNQLIALIGVNKAAMLADLTLDVVDLECKLQQLQGGEHDAYVGHETLSRST